MTIIGSFFLSKSTTNAVLGEDVDLIIYVFDSHKFPNCLIQGVFAMVLKKGVDLLETIHSMLSGMISRLLVSSTRVKLFNLIN